MNDKDVVVLKTVKAPSIEDFNQLLADARRHAREVGLKSTTFVASTRSWACSYLPSSHRWSYLEVIMTETHDGTIDRVRRARHEISEEFGHDPRRLVGHYMELQRKHADRLLDAVAPTQGARRETA